MGFNTVALFLNDRTDKITTRPEYMQRLARAMAGGQGDEGCSGMQVLPSVHADGLQIVAAGGNRATLLGIAHWRDEPEAILRKLADQHGFRLVRKSQRLRKEGE